MPPANDSGKRFSALIEEFHALDPQRDNLRAREILAEAASLLDPKSEPKKWAALRSLYGKNAENTDLPGAIQAYRDALTVWDRESDRDSWAACHGGLGYLLTRIAPPSSEGMEEALAHLECAVGEHPFWASLLAVLYRFRTSGDPYENWWRRVHYLEMALSRVVREENPQGWARAQNDLGEAFGDEPDGDFLTTLERRITCHEAALEALGKLRDETFLETSLLLSECLLFRGPGGAEKFLAAAEHHARQALMHCNGMGKDLQAKALLGLAKVLVVPNRRPDAAALKEAMTLLDQAADQLDSGASPALAATVESFRANVCLKRISLGETGLSDTLALHADQALKLLSGDDHMRDRRSILQVAGEGLLAEGKFARAADYLHLAVNAADQALAGAESIAGRMERIWEFRDSSALLGYCLACLGRFDESLRELDRGKARFWQKVDRPWQAEELTKLIPPGGALLFPNFSGPQGMVAAVTEAGNKLIHTPRFGQARLLELQRGGREAEELGGWLKAYALRTSQPSAWRAEIDGIGAVLWEEVWSPVLAALAELGVGPGAELVWFPQGGSGIFPMHAAWRMEKERRQWLLEDYTVRNAPSVRALLTGGDDKVNEPVAALMVSNPSRDLAYSELECAWVRRSLQGRKVQWLQGAVAEAAPVKAALARANIVHFSSHALFDVNRPLQSFLLLANGERLTLEELLPIIGGKFFHLVVLSACETAMSRATATPDEFLGFPAAFLHAGTKVVLATLWPVDDAASAVLIGRFYWEWCERSKTPARALRDAQNWLRRATVRELMELLRRLKDEPPPAGPLAARCRTHLRGNDPESCPYAEPYFWAAFTLFGKE